MKQTFKIEGMHCGKCTAKVEKTLSALKGVVSVSVSLEEACADVEYDEILVSDAAISDAVKEAGFEVVG